MLGRRRMLCVERGNRWSGEAVMATKGEIVVTKVLISNCDRMNDRDEFVSSFVSKTAQLICQPCLAMVCPFD